MDTLQDLTNYALSRGYEVTLFGNFINVTNVNNDGNDFIIVKRKDGYYSVTTINVSERGYADLAKCVVYQLIADYYKACKQAA